MKSIFSLLVAMAVAHSAFGADFKPNIEYGKGGGIRLLLDASVPEGDGPFPVAIIVHGGGWSSGDKQSDIASRDISPLFEPLTQGRFTWFSINYQLAPTHRWPACFEDVQTAIRWVKAHAVEYKGDPSQIALIGHSAGGHLVCLAAALADDATRVQAVVGLAAVTDMVADTERRGGLSTSLQALLNLPPELTGESRTVLREISPIAHVKPGLPPFLLIQGSADKTVPWQQSASFQAKLKEAGVPCDLITLTNAQHSIVDWEKFDPGYKDWMVGWLKRTLVAGRAPVGTGTK
jgi:alpha-L-fucosidase 2